MIPREEGHRRARKSSGVMLIVGEVLAARVHNTFHFRSTAYVPRFPCELQCEEKVVRQNGAASVWFFGVSCRPCIGPLHGLSRPIAETVRPIFN